MDLKVTANRAPTALKGAPFTGKEYRIVSRVRFNRFWAPKCLCASVLRNDTMQTDTSPPLEVGVFRERIGQLDETAYFRRSKTLSK